MKTGIKILLAVMPLLLIGVGVATASQLHGDAKLVTSGVKKVLTLPEAAAHSRVISLGEAYDPESSRIVEGYAIIHRKDKGAKPDGVGNKKPPKNSDSSDCYAYMAKGAKWKTVEPWYLNSANTEGLTDDYVLANMVANVAKWEDAADGVVDGVSGTDIVGEGVSTIVTLAADTESPDALNEVYFGSIDEPGVIAVTIVWGVFGGPPHSRELIEWDMVFDQDDFDWSANGAASMMDFENIATHELGHTIGLGHPESTCVNETMYAYASEGEILKRDLHAGDIAGTDGLY